MPIAEAVERAVFECMKEGILAEFLTKYRREAIQVSIFEYDEERELCLIREDERKQGRAEGRKEGREEGKRALLKCLIRKKWVKRKNVAQIAEELETSEEEVCKLLKEIERENK